MSKLTIYLLGTAFFAGGLAVTMYKLGVLNVWTSVGITVIIGIGVKLAWSQPRKKNNSDVTR
jgi:hypothetical protein